MNIRESWIIQEQECGKKRPDVKAIKKMLTEKTKENAGEIRQEGEVSTMTIFVVKTTKKGNDSVIICRAYI